MNRERNPARAGLLLALGLMSCGARSPLEVEPPAPDGGTDAPRICGAERCNGLDDDCDDRTDEAMPLVALGPPIVIRDETELDAGDCTSCFWAWSPILARHDDGFDAIFRISIDGGREEPNVFIRSLDPHGVPRGPNRSAGPEVALDLQALDAETERARVIATCWRIGSGDVPGLTRIGPDGTFVRDVYAGPYCEPLELADERVVSVLRGTERVADVRSRALDGSDVRTGRIPLDEVYFTTTGSDGSRVGVLLLRIEGDVRTLWFAALSPTGETIVAPRMLDVPYESYPRLVGTREGFLLVSPARDGMPARRTLLSREGERLTPLAPFDDGHALADSDLSDVFVRGPGGTTLAHVFQRPTGDLDATLVVQLLDARGDLLRSFEDEAPGTGVVASPSVIFEGDRLLVTWHDIAADSTRNRVYVRELGCPP